ncbi:MAG: hypothetical protein ACKN93_00790, partial [Candidatus Limnocylindrus sp.]
MTSATLNDQRHACDRRLEEIKVIRLFFIREEMRCASCSEALFTPVLEALTELLLQLCFHISCTKQFPCDAIDCVW